MHTEEDILLALSQVLEQRKHADPKDSYVSSLYHKGLDHILKKIGEEATETVIAAKGDNQDALIYETADLWFHCMVLLTHKNIPVEQVLAELARRFGLSGIEEKANRKKT